jgi:hypothetical protein
MSATPNLAIEHILQSQAQKEVTANEAFDALDQAIAGLLEVDVSAGGTVTVDPAAALACKMLRLTGMLAADAEVVVPDNRKPYFVHNATAGGFAVTVRTATGPGVTVGASPDNTAVVYCDGADVLAISAGTAGGAGGAGALIELGDTDIALRTIEVALANPDAETGDVSGWTTTGTWEAGTAEGTITAPHAGSFYFSATGGTDPAILEQTVDLVAQGFTAAELDADATFDAGIWAASEYQSDTGELKLQFLDAADADVGPGFTTGEFGPNDGTWVEQTLTGDVPAGARQVRVQLLAHNHFGSNTTYGFDDLSLSLSVRRPVTGDLLRYDGGDWVGVTAGEILADAGLGDLGDVDASDTTPGYVLTREADGSFALRAVGGGSASTKVFDGASDGGDTYTLSPEPQGTVLVWVDGLLETDYSVAGGTLAFGTAPANGAAVVAWDIGGGGPPYDIGVYFPGQPEADATLLQLVASRPFTLPADLTGSQGYAGTAPTSQADLDIQKNGASIGTITFAAATSTATFAFPSEVVFAAGDRLTVLAPGSQDASLADISITFKGTRS